MNLQPASRKEIKRIAIGTVCCDGIMIAGLFLLSQFGIGSFELSRILLGAAIGSVVAILNFTVLCITVQGAVGMEDQKKMKQKFQVSYNFRMLFQAGWVVLALLLPGVHVIAGAAPLLFPNVTIFYLQATGKLLPPDPPRAPKAEESGEVSEPAAESGESEA